MLSDRPTFTAAEAQKIALDHYSISSLAKRLPSERDQNFRLTDESGNEFVLKISGVSEQLPNLEFQNNVITHLRSKHDERFFPRICRTTNGEEICKVIDEDGRTHFVRLLTFLQGKPLVEINPHTPELFYQFGRFLGQMDKALQTFSSPIPSHDLQWDFKHAHLVIRNHIKYIENETQRNLVAKFLALFEEAVLPQFNNLRASVIHNDANDHNVIVENNQIAGIIDFGDMVQSFTDGELAIGMAYAMLDKADPLTLGAHIVRGYHEVFPLTDLELALLYPLICIRLCVSVSLSAYRQKKAPEDKYLTISEAPAWKLLTQLAESGADLAHFMFRQAAGLPSLSCVGRITKWLHENSSGFQLAIPFNPDKAFIFDLSVGSPEIGSLDLLDDTQAFTAMIFEKMSKAGAKVGIGRYDEARLIYRDEAFKSIGNEGDEWRTIHLGIDLFVEPGTPVFAPLDGKVHSFQNNAAPLDYGPTIILEHDTGQDKFYTLYGHLSLDSLPGLSQGKRINKGELIARIGDTAVNGGWPPHLHLQIITDLMGNEGNFPGVALPSQRQIWLELCPNPNLILGLPDHLFPPKRMATNQILEERQKHLGKSLSISYKKPLNIVRGWRQYLYDETGRPYLDCVNNVCHVGHSHPKVVKALQKQAAVLNTNTRYLHDNLVEYAQCLCEALPPSLSVCFFVCSGSEAN